jgi:hypothetical protein
MIQFVTLQEASDHLRRDTDDDDNDLLLKIKASSGAVQNYLKKSYAAYYWQEDTNGDTLLDSAGDPIPQLDTAGDPIVREEVKLATLYLIGVMYKDRDGQESQKWSFGYLPTPVLSLLYPLRDPAMA